MEDELLKKIHLTQDLWGKYRKGAGEIFDLILKKTDHKDWVLKLMTDGFVISDDSDNICSVENFFLYEGVVTNECFLDICKRDYDAGYENKFLNK